MNLLWKLAFRNLFRNRRRSVTTGIAIMVGFVGLVLLGGYIFRIQKGLIANTVYLNLNGHLQIHRKGSLENFNLRPKKYLIDPEMDLQLEQALACCQKEVEFQGKFLTGTGLIVSGKLSQPFLGFGFERKLLPRAIEHPWVQQWSKTLAEVGRTPWTEDLLQDPILISITPRIAGILGKLADFSRLSEEQKEVQLMTRTLDNDLNAVEAKLGLLHSTGASLAEDTSVRLPLKLLQDLIGTSGYQYRSLFLKNLGEAKIVQAKLREQFRQRNLDFEVYQFTEGSVGEFYVGTMNFLYVMGAFFVFLICGLVILSVVNSLTLGILERTRELGTLKAIGFSTQQTVGIFVREAIWLAGMALVMGLAVAQVTAWIINSADFRFSPPGIEGDVQFLVDPDPRTSVLIAMMLMTVSVLTSYWVSKTKLKKPAIELLQESGV